MVRSGIDDSSCCHDAGINDHNTLVRYDIVATDVFASYVYRRLVSSNCQFCSIFVQWYLVVPMLNCCY